MNRKLIMTTALSALLFGTVAYAPSADAAFKRYDRTFCNRLSGPSSSSWDCPILDDTALPKAGGGGITGVNVHIAVGNGGNAGAATCVHYAWSTNYTGTCSGSTTTSNSSGSSQLRVITLSGSALNLWSTYVLDGFGYIHTDGYLNELQGYYTSN